MGGRRYDEQAVIDGPRSWIPASGKEEHECVPPSPLALEIRLSYVDWFNASGFGPGTPRAFWALENRWRVVAECLRGRTQRHTCVIEHIETQLSNTF